MGWYPATYPRPPFHAARAYYTATCSYIGRLGLPPPANSLASRTGARHIALINLSAARCLTVLWDLGSVGSARPDSMPAEFRFDDQSPNSLQRNLYQEFCRQLRDTRMEEYAGGIWEYDLADEFEDVDMDDPTRRGERDSLADERALVCIAADAWHYLHDADEFDLMAGFGGSGEWNGGAGRGRPPVGFRDLPWNTPSVLASRKQG